MRRISILALVMLLGFSSLAWSRYYRSYRFRTPVRYRTRYSPYALGRTRSGLISGHVRYSPYALGRSKSGLVPDNVRYSPYALAHDRSGLVADAYYHNYYADCYPYGIWFSGRGRYVIDYDVEHLDHKSPLGSSKSSLQTSDPPWEITFHRRVFPKQTAPKEPDPKLVIYKYLKSKKINFKMDNGFTVANKTISANFLLRDKNIVIKYWNPQTTEEMIDRSDLNNKMYDKYLQKWTALLENYQKAGLTVIEITSPDQKEILSQLTTLTEQNG